MEIYSNRFSKWIWLLVLCSNLFAFAGAQTPFQKDSVLMDKLSAQIKDSISPNPDKALMLANDLIQLAEKNHYSKGFVIAYNFIGSIYQRQSNWTLAINNFNKSIAQARAGHFQKELSNTLYNMAGLFVKLSDYEKAFEYVNESLEIKSKLADSAGIGRCYRQLAECMFYKKDFKKANEYSEKGLAILRKFNNAKSLGVSLSSYGIILIEQKKYPEALAYLLEAKNIYVKNKVNDLLGDVALNLGFCYDNMGQFDSSLAYYNIGMQYAIEDEDLTHQVVLFNNMGELLFKQNKLKEAEENYLKCLSLAQKINSLLDIQSVQKNLAILYQKKGDFKQALKYSKDFEATSDSLYNEQKTKAIEDVSIRYETKHTDEKNKFLQSENTIEKLKNKQKIYYLIALVLLVVVIGAFVWAYFKRKQLENKNRTNALRQKLLLNQMNPHFVFNSIDNIQSLIYNKQDEAAIMYLTKFSKLTRQILENATEDYIPLSDEIAILENYINIQKLLFGDHFSYQLNAENVDTENILVPPMLAQPFVENAIKHGLNEKKEGGLIDIRFYWKEKHLFFEVVDNGSGISIHSANKNGQHKSMANTIVAERLGQKSGTILTQNKTDADGNIIGAISTFEIPYTTNL